MSIVRFLIELDSYMERRTYGFLLTREKIPLIFIVIDSSVLGIV